MTEDITREEYKGFELFISPQYNYMTCIRKKHCDDIYVATFAEAKQVVDEMIILTDYEEWYKTKYNATFAVVSKKYIKEFVTGD